MDINYCLYKRIIQETPISKTYNCFDKNTKYVWKAKVFDLEVVSNYEMQQVLQYNEQVLTFTSKQSQNIIYLQKVFKKDQSQYIITEMFDERLSSYLDKQKNGLKNQQQIKKILQDILISICDIYKQDYRILNLRLEHIVRVNNQVLNTKVWKIQSLVFDYDDYNLPTKCQYQFDYQWASNQEKLLKDKIPEEQKDQQIVWYMGVLAVRLVLGNKFKIKQIYNDSDLNKDQLTKKCHPEILQLILKSIKANKKDRITLKDFLNLKIFQKLYLAENIKQKFITGLQSRILKSSIMKSTLFKKSQIRKDQLRSSIKFKITQSIYHMNVQKKISEAQQIQIYNNLKWELQKIYYLAEIKKYIQQKKLLNQINNEDIILITFIYLKITVIKYFKLKEQIYFNNKLHNFRLKNNLFNQISQQIPQNSSIKEKQISFNLENFKKQMLKLNLDKLNILKCFKRQCLQLVNSIKKDSINLQYDKLIEYLKLFSGKFYSIIRRNLQKDTNMNKSIHKRTLSYLSFSVFLIHCQYIFPEDLQLKMLRQNDLIFCNLNGDSQKNHHKKNCFKICEYTQNTNQDQLIQNSQQIIKKFFKITNQNNAINKNEKNIEESIWGSANILQSNIRNI